MERNLQGTWPLAEHLLFLGRFLRSPRTVGAIAPSSRALARSMVAGIDWSPGVRVIELGPGTGAFTAVIARRLPPDGRYLGIEREPAFVAMLERRWPALEYACDSVENLMRIAAERAIFPADHVISGLPFASLPPAATRVILDGLVEVLKPGGSFTTFQYLQAYALPAARAFRRLMEERFGAFQRRAVVLRNLPPAFVLTWRRAR